MTPDFTIAYEIANLKNVLIYDTSVFDSSTLIQDVQSVRMLFATVNSVNTAQKNVTSLIAYKQYVVTSGSISINGHSYVNGDYIYLVNDIVISGNVSIDETGYYATIVNWIPSTGTFVSFTPSQLIYGCTDAIFPDNVFTMNYELYGVKIIAATSLTNTTQYIVNGSQENSILLNGSTYYVGEIFTTVNTNAFTNVTGTNFVCPLINISTGYFRTWYHNWIIWSQYINTISTNYQLSEQTEANFLAITARINQCDLYESQQFGVSLNGIQDLINNVNTQYPLS